MVNVYEAVDSNKRKSAIVIAGFIAFIFTASFFISKGLAAYYGYESTGLELTGLAMLISGVSSFVSYYFSDKIVLGLSGARPADRKHDFAFFTVTQNLSMAAGVPMPKLYVIEDTALNAFATGRDPAHATICATTGLLSTLNRTELEGVVGHELSHVTNYDTRLMSIVVVLVGLVTLLGDWLIRSSWHVRGSKDRNNGQGLFILLGFVLAILSPIVARLIQLAISRRREFLADAGSVKLTRQPGGLIAALQKLGADREPLEAANKATAHLYIVNPLNNQKDTVGWFAKLFNTHPPITERIAILQDMA